MENKELLLKYLSMALPYGVKIMFSHNGFRWDWEQTLEEIRKCEDGEYAINGWGIHGIKPYLRPLSSMNEVERKEFDSISDEGFGKALDLQIAGGSDLDVTGLEITASYNNIQYLLEHHFDFMDLIPKWLALEAPEGMYNDKK